MCSLATILSAAARFIAPGIAGTIHQDVRECSTQAALGHRRSVETVQAWMIVCSDNVTEVCCSIAADDGQVYFWKDPRDNRAWTYVGLLCRLAVEIGLNRTSTSNGPETGETVQRERRNRTRTWML